MQATYLALHQQPKLQDVCYAHANVPERVLKAQPSVHLTFSGPGDSQLTDLVQIQLLDSLRNSAESGHHLTNFVYDLFQFLARPLVGVFTTEQKTKFFKMHK